MARPDPQFEDRLNREYDLKGRTRTAAYLSLVLYAMFIGLDAVYTPQYFVTFLFLRLSVMAGVGVILLLLERAKTSRAVMNIALALALIDAAGIAIMIYLLGGFLTSYYQGLNIIVMGMIVLIPLAFRYTIYLYVSVWFMYTVPSVARYLLGQKVTVIDGVEIQSWRFVVNNLYFLTSIVIVGAIGSSVMESIRRRELRSRLQLEETTAQLQESNVKLKSLDELKTQFFANVNHELRTPLTLILAPLKAVLEGRMGSCRRPSRTPSRRCSATATSSSSSSTTSST
jgi:signal transduction histidine kinase